MQNSSTKWLWIILLAAGGLYSIGIWWGLPDFEGWAPDELTPARVIAGLRQGFSGGWCDTYPPLHYYVLSLCYSPLLILHKLHVVHVMSLPVYTILFYVSRLVSVCMALAIVYLMYRIGQEMVNETAGLLAAVLTALLMPLNYYAKVANVDVPYLFWFVWSLLFYVRVLKWYRPRDMMWFAGLAAAAICTKDQAYALYMLPIIYAIYRYYRHWQESRNDHSLKAVLLNGPLLQAMAVFALVIIIVQNWLFNWRGVLNHFRYITGPGKEFAEFPASLSGHLAMFMKTIDHFSYAFGWPGFLLCLCGLALAVVDKKIKGTIGGLWLFALSYYVFFITVIRYNYVRFLLPMFLILILSAAYGLASKWNNWHRFPLLRWVFLILINVYSLWHTVCINWLMIKDSRYRVEKWMAANIPENARVGITSLRMYGPRWPGIVEMLEQKADVMKLNPDYLLVNVDELSRFDDRSPQQRFYRALKEKKSRYVQIFSCSNRLCANRLKNWAMLTNLVHINPTIEIYKRTDLIPAR